MRFEATGIAGLWRVRLGWHTDARGGFLRLFDSALFAAAGLPAAFAQTSLSVTRQAGSLRGLHLQRPPHAEVKLVRCLRGALHDVVVDFRENSATYRQHRSFALTAGDDVALCIPAGCAHGFQTLADATEVLYQISQPYAPDHAGGLRYDDPALGIAWPRPVSVISERDRTWPLL